MSDRDVRDLREPLQPEKSLGDLFSELTTDLSDLFRKEVTLAKVEARDEISQAGKAAGMLAGAGVAGWLALVMVSFAAAWLLDRAMPTDLAFLIVAVVWAIAAAAMAAKGKRRMKDIEPLPETTASLKEDLQWNHTTPTR